MMQTFSVIVEKCPQTGLYVGYVPGLPGAHAQAETLDELKKNLCEVLSMLLENGRLEGELSLDFYLANFVPTIKTQCR
jgi:predicted RNase H-like HicB family nuclease